MAGKFQWLGITLLAAIVGLLSGTLSAYQLLKVPLQHLSPGCGAGYSTRP